MIPLEIINRLNGNELSNSVVLKTLAKFVKINILFIQRKIRKWKKN